MTLLTFDWSIDLACSQKLRREIYTIANVRNMGSQLLRFGGSA